MNKILKLTFLFLIAVSLSQVRAQQISFNDLTFEDLNGHSLREVFAEGYDNLTDMSPLNSTYVFDNNTFVIMPNSLSRFGGFRYSTLDLTHEYYISTNLKSDSVISKFRFGSDSGYLLYNYTDIGFYEYVSYKVTTHQNTAIIFYNNAPFDLSPFEIYDTRIYDLTVLGIDNLTKEQMDYYYNLYKQHEGGYALDTNAFSFNVFQRFTEFFYIMLEYAQLGMDFLFTTQTIGFDGIVIFGERYFTFNLKFIPFYSITTLAISMTLIYLGKKYIPFL